MDIQLLALSELLRKQGLHFKRLYLKGGRYHAHIAHGETLTCVGIHEDPAEAVCRAVADLRSAIEKDLPTCSH